MQILLRHVYLWPFNSDIVHSYSAIYIWLNTVHCIYICIKYIQMAIYFLNLYLWPFMNDGHNSHRTSTRNISTTYYVLLYVESLPLAADEDSTAYSAPPSSGIRT